MEEKSRTAGTKRRRETGGVHVTTALSRRVTRLAKTLKAANPTHCYVSDLSAAFTTISTTGSLREIGGNIQQGDDYNQRFGSHVDLLRLVLKGVISPGSTAAAISTVRITVFQGQSNLAFAANLFGSYNPIVDSTSTRVYFDKYYSVGPSNAAASFGGVPVHINLKTKHRQKFSGAGSGTNTGESIYMIIQSDKAAGTTAPGFTGGFLEEWFKP